MPACRDSAAFTPGCLVIVLLRSFVLTHPLPHTRARTLPGQVLGRLAPAVGAEAAGCAAVTAVFSHLAQTCVDFALVSRWEGGGGRVVSCDPKQPKSQNQPTVLVVVGRSWGGEHGGSRKGRWVCALVRGLHLFGDRMLLDH